MEKSKNTKIERKEVKSFEPVFSRIKALKFTATLSCSEFAPVWCYSGRIQPPAVTFCFSSAMKPANSSTRKNIALKRRGRGLQGGWVWPVVETMDVPCLTFELCTSGTPSAKEYALLIKK